MNEAKVRAFAVTIQLMAMRVGLTPGECVGGLAISAGTLIGLLRESMSEDDAATLVVKFHQLVRSAADEISKHPDKTEGYFEAPGNNTVN